MRNVKGQITIFIIVAILLFIGLAIFFLARSTTIGVSTGTEFSPERYMSSCVRQAVRDTVATMLPQGGTVAPDNYVLFNETRVSYLCKTIAYGQPCVNQYPRYLFHLQEEVRANVANEVPACFDALTNELERRQYTVEKGSHHVQVTLKPEIIEVAIPLTMRLTKNGVTQAIDAFDISIRSPLYDLGFVAQEIVAQEANYCYFEYVGYMLLYPAYDIRVTTLSDATKLYSVTHLPTQTTLQFAVRGCAFPPGI